MNAPRFPADLATVELSELAKTLRDDAARPAGQRRLIGTPGRTLELAADVLDKLALREDPRDLIDGRIKAFPMLKAVEAVIDAAHDRAKDWPDAILTAAVELDLNVRTIERHWVRYLRERGMTQADYVFPG
jgi:hypothetical protein